MRRSIRVVIIAVVLMLFTFTAFTAGLVIGGAAHIGPDVAQAASEPAQFTVFWQAWDLVHEKFVDRTALDPQALTYGAIRGMLQALGDDGHTAFLTPEELARHQSDISGEYSGIGAQIGMRDGLPVIVAPFDGSPAEKAGIKAGDFILEVNGEDVTTWLLNDIVETIRGPEGSQLVLTILRPDQSESMDFTITRGEIDLPAATWAMVPDTKVALIRLSQFSADAEKDMVEALRGAQDAGAEGLIVDIRNNPGGLLEQAIRVPSQFLSEGDVLLQEDAQGHRQAFPVVPGGIATDIPMVVLANRGSASSAEIFAGAIQDYERGQVVGETTFGTGTVLESFTLTDGSSLMLGTRQWLTPSGRYLRKQGVEPDITVELPIGADLVSPDELKDMSSTDLLQSEDTQIIKALEVLNALPADSAAPAE